jgi:uncharacterized protein (DUF4415 family)
VSAKSMKKELISRTDWGKLHQEDDSDIDYTDSPATTEEFWKNAEVVKPHHKTHLSVDFDDDVVKYFKRYGSDYITRMNSALRFFINIQKKQKHA